MGVSTGSWRGGAIDRARRHRVALLILVDAVAWLVAMYLACSLRLETWRVAPMMTMGEVDGNVPLGGVLLMTALAAALHLFAASAVKLNRGRHLVGGFEESFVLGSMLLAVGVLTGVINLLVGPPYPVPRSVPFTAAVIAVLLAIWPRVLWRYLVTEPRNTAPEDATSVVIVGAGATGRELVRSMLRDDHSSWAPRAFVDDSSARRHFRHLGVPVAGRVADLVDVARSYEAGTVIIAIPSLDAAVIRTIYDQSVASGLRVKVVPSFSELVGGDISVKDVRDVKPEDLLGRRAIDTDVTAIGGFLADKRVLVTGAGGSIGSELSRQIQQYGPASLALLDRDESALHALLLSIYGRADLGAAEVVLADIRDADRIAEVFEQYQPQVVFHAAALKHVNVLQNHPAEAVKTNVWGTANVLAASAAYGVERFVNISTDKAAAPQNVLGCSKRLAEGLTAAYAAAREGTYLSVRFGNVLGTRGSVLTTFAAQIESGGPVTITHPEVTRYFMTVNEAVQLVIQAAAIGGDGEALVLDMGEPVRIMDVARRMIEHSGKDVQIALSGLKPGEKLHEVLFGDGEDDHRPRHRLVSHVTVTPVDPAQVEKLAQVRDEALPDAMMRVCTTMTGADLTGGRR